MAAALCVVGVMLPVQAQGPAAGGAHRHRDLRRTHEQVVYNMVQIRTASVVGTGWLLAQSGRPLVVTNKHVADRVGHRGATVLFYRGTRRSPARVRATRMHRSDRIDLALLRLESDPPRSARPLRFRTDVTVVRGQRVVLGGNPTDGNRGILPFQTTEGVVTGHVSGDGFEQCGAGRNCVVVDAASLGGSSGGPAFNLDGELVGMLWGGPQLAGRTRSVVVVEQEEGQLAAALGEALARVENPTLSYLIHARTIAAELRRLERE